MITYKDKGDLAPKKRKVVYKDNKEQGLVNQVNRANSTDLTSKAFVNNNINKVENIGLKTTSTPIVKTSSPVVIPVTRSKVIDEEEDIKLSKLNKGVKKIKIYKK